MPKSPEQLNIEKREVQEQEPSFSEQNLLDPELTKNIHEAAEVARVEEGKNPEKMAALHEELDRLFGSVSTEGTREFLSQEEKQEKWGKTLEDVEGIVDSRDKPIDRGIKETVAGFLVNDFPTLNSCEGHVEKREGKTRKVAPFVEIGKEGPDVRYVGEMELKHKVASEFGISYENLADNKDADDEYWRQLLLSKPSETPEYIAAREQNERMQGAVDSLLDDFYKERPHVKCRIATQKCMSDGCFLVTTRPKGEKNGIEIGKKEMPGAKQELVQEQQEFDDFAEFLKEQFFGK